MRGHMKDTARHFWIVVCYLAFACIYAPGAEPAGNPVEKKLDKPIDSVSSATTRALYRLGPGDEISVSQPNAEELDDKVARVDDAGFVNLPLAGRLHVGGLTVEQTETVVRNELSKLLLNPRPVVSITKYRSQPVSVLGAVNTPGVIQLEGRKTLVELISLAGGLRQDAGVYVQITRRISYGHIPA